MLAKMTQDSPPLLVSVTEAARLINVDPRTIYRMIAAKRLKTVRLGPKSMRVSVDSIHRLAGLKEEED